MSVDACPEIDPRGCLTAVPFFMFQFEQRRQVPMCQPPGMGLLVDDGTRSDRGREKEIAIHRQRFAHGITADADSGEIQWDAISPNPRVKAMTKLESDYVFAILKFI